MFRFMRDVEPEDPMFLMDPFAIHRQHMSRMLSGGFGYSPFLSITDGNMPGTRPASRRMQQAGAVSPFGMLGMSGGFMDMFGMMNDMIGNMEHMTAGGNCQTFSSSTVISYSNTGDGAPKVYQETSEMRSAPGGVSGGALLSQRRSGRHGGLFGIQTVDWSRCPLGITSGTGLTSSSAPETIARGTRRSGRTISTWMRVRPQRLMTSGGGRRPDSGSSVPWSFGGLSPQGLG
ncbi:MLF2 isoform 4, partial [Pan troglodytes]